MYKYELSDSEETVDVFDELFVKQGKNGKNTTAVLTNERLMFLDYLIPDEGAEVLRIARGLDYIKYKEVYYQIFLMDIEELNVKNKYYEIVLKNKIKFKFDSKKLYEEIKNELDGTF